MFIILLTMLKNNDKFQIIKKDKILKNNVIKITYKEITETTIKQLRKLIFYEKRF